MKSVVIYFSQTGNTEKTARAIQTGVKQVTGSCDILTLKEANPRKLYEYDLIGLGSPVFDLAEPGNITAFINSLRFVGGKHIFSFCTHCTMGFRYFPSVVPKMQKKGLIVIGWRDWYATSWSPISMPTPYYTDGHPDEIDLKEAEEFGREMAWRSQKIYAGDKSLIPPTPDPVPMPQLLDEDLNERHTHEKYLSGFKFKKDKCLYPKCRICMDACPMYGIDLSVNPPVFMEPCLRCFFCEQVCPTGAIEVNVKWLDENREKGEEILKATGVKFLTEAERQGRFRRLIPEDKIGWDRPVYKAHPNHPRWIIGKGPN
jgi:ferredoxin/flavodoxin